MGKKKNVSAIKNIRRTIHRGAQAVFGQAIKDFKRSPVPQQAALGQLAAMVRKTAAAAGKTIKQRRRADRRQGPGPSRGLGSNMNSGSGDALVRAMMAILDPWSPLARGASLPTRSEGPSYKVSCVVRDTLVTSSSCGTLVVCPTLANNAPCAIISNNSSTFTGSALSTTAVTGTKAVSMTNLPFSSANLLTATDENYVNGRIVGFGYRLTYVSSESNKGGSYYAIQNPSRGSVNGFSTDNIGNAAYANVRAIDRNRLQETLFPLTSRELDFTNEQSTDSCTLYPMGNASAYSATLIPAAAGVLIIPAAASSYMVELIVHCEYVGRGAAPFYTTTHVDPESWDMFQCALGELELARSGFENGDSPAQRMGVILEYLRQSVPNHRVTKTCASLLGMMRANERQSNRSAQKAGALIAIGPTGHF